MKIIDKNIDDLIPYINNAKKHPAKQIDQIAASIKEFGFNNPVLLDGANGIIAGHGRVEAAKKLKLNEVPCLELSHLSDIQKRAFILAANRLSEGGEWDEEILSLELDSLFEDGFNVELTGFEIPDFSPSDENDQGDLSNIEPKIIDCPHCGEKINLND